MQAFLVEGGIAAWGEPSNYSRFLRNLKLLLLQKVVGSQHLSSDALGKLVEQLDYLAKVRTGDHSL